ncbi:hypothetical protein BDQ17DRAFT_1425045 [Cyathus striatus]|nr:hypothetical protein BDQ17DRAFT_1425045 [Cyathus striatus]
MTTISRNIVSHHPYIPPEIMQNIIDFSFDILDFSEVKSISLCNTTLFYCARRHPKFQFQELNLSSQSKLANFHSFVSDFPKSGIPRRVKKLSIHVGSGAQNGSSDVEVDILNHLLSSDLFPNVAELIIVGCDEGGPIPLNKLRMPLLSNQISKLTFRNLILPRNVIVHSLTVVKELSLLDVECDLAVEVPNNCMQIQSRLEKLELHPEFNEIFFNIFLQEPEPTKRYCMLKHIALINYCPFSHWQFVLMVLIKLEVTLEYVTITFAKEFHNRKREVEDVFDTIRKLPNLKGLTILLPLAYEGLAYSMAFHMVHEFLSHKNFKITISLTRHQRRAVEINRKLLGIGDFEDLDFRDVNRFLTRRLLDKDSLDPRFI